MFEYFFDPVLRAPTIGSMLMCLGASLVGVLAYLRKSSLVGETLSHAAYPGVILGVIYAAVFGDQSPSELFLSCAIILGALVTASMGLIALYWLEHKVKIHADAALCFILATFFGVGITLASRIQMVYATLYTQGLTYLYGQAATMTDRNIWIYGVLAFLIILMVALLYKELEMISFDREYAKSLGVSIRFVDTLLFFLIAVAVVVGIRSVGVVLMSASLIAPAISARQYTNTLYKMLLIAAFFGVMSGFLGNVLSFHGSVYLQQKYPGARIILPTGPMIVIVSACFCLFSLLFAKERGVIVKLYRRFRFKIECLSENILKVFWRFGPVGERVTLKEVQKYYKASPILFRLMLKRLEWTGWVEKKEGDYRLTSDGQKRASHIVRLHRLWELYLADYLGIGVEKVHKSAEEMEHILTPEIERELDQILLYPHYDPHRQPIPKGKSP